MSVPDAAGAPRVRRAPDVYATIVVIGGGCYGAYYARQLARAAAADAVRWDQLLIVDRDPACRVARAFGEGSLVVPRATVVTESWDAFLLHYLGAAGGLDAIVPSPLMPHLFFEWLAERARRRWPGRAVGTVALDRPPSVPWERAGADGMHYASFATWMCPINCIEPARCPHTRGPRDWSMPDALRAYADEERRAGRPVAGPVVFHCTHRAYGVGMIDVAALLEGDALVAREGTGGGARVLVSTASHCHAAVGVLRLDA
ncbi:MAG TPA: hypothetical protein VNA89_06475 [Gemmatimonadaceae bacterium]|nr:hypothetical protein [Gemmatimonadaceae bacterium]